MNHTETIELTRYVQALCPAQKLDQYSADAWHDVIGDLPLGLAKRAAAACARQKPFVAQSEIVAAAIRLRRAVKAQIDREANDVVNPPQGGLAYVEWRRQRSIEATREADRRIARGVYDLTKVDIAEDLGGEEALFNDPRPLTRVDGRPAIEAKRIEDEPTVPLAEVLAKAREIRDASREPKPETEPAA